MYPIDRRLIASLIYSKLQSLRKTAELLMVSHSTISRWLRSPEKRVYKRKTNGQYKSEIIIDIIKLTIKNNPFVSLIALRSIILNTLKIQVSKELIRTALVKNGFVKKKAYQYGKRKDQENIVNQFINTRNKYLQEGRNIVAIDETSFGRNGIETKGYVTKGTKLIVDKKNPTLVSKSMVCAVTQDALLHKVIKKGSFNKTSFLDFIKSLDLKANTVVLLDNVKFHHCKVLQQYCKDNLITLLYTPPYSPWFNPIELCFSIIKRKYYQCQDIETSIRSLTTEHLVSFFNKSLNCCGCF